jgi:hypothetical protein
LFCCLPKILLPRLRDAAIEVTMFKHIFEPDEQIQALVTFAHNYDSIKKITMSLYMMIEIKDPEDNDLVLKNHTVAERIYEEVFDVRKFYVGKIEKT